MKKHRAEDDGKEPPAPGSKDAASETEPYLMSIADAAKVSGLSEYALRAASKSADPPPGFWVGRNYKIYRADFEAYLRRLSQEHVRIDPA